MGGWVLRLLLLLLLSSLGCAAPPDVPVTWISAGTRGGQAVLLGTPQQEPQPELTARLGSSDTSPQSTWRAVGLKPLGWPCDPSHTRTPS